MALTYVIKARAQREIERAAEWWWQNRAAAPGAVRRDIEDALGMLILPPGILFTAGSRGEPVNVQHHS